MVDFTTENEDTVIENAIDDVCNRIETLEALLKAEDLTVDEIGDRCREQARLRFSNPSLLAFVLMANLESTMSVEPIDLTTEDKAFWLIVANELGPDWIAKFRRIGHFMNVVDKA